MPTSKNKTHKTASVINTKRLKTTKYISTKTIFISIFLVLFSLFRLYASQWTVLMRKKAAPIKVNQTFKKKPTLLVEFCIKHLNVHLYSSARSIESMIFFSQAQPCLKLGVRNAMIGKYVSDLQYHTSSLYSGPVFSLQTQPCPRIPARKRRCKSKTNAYFSKPNLAWDPPRNNNKEGYGMELVPVFSSV
jgi:hypothetical protein